MPTLQTLPSELDLVLYAGDGFSVTFTFKAPDGSPWPTTGAWAAEIRASTAGAALLDNFTIDNDEATGRVTASLTGDQVRALGNSAVYDLQQVAPDAEPRTWFRGDITVVGDVTRDD